MKPNALLFLLSGIVIGAVAGVLLAPERPVKMKKGPAKNKNVAGKFLRKTASKYEKELREMVLVFSIS